MIGWHVVVGTDANIDGLTGVVVQKQDMGGGLQRVYAVVLALNLVAGRRRVMLENFGRVKLFTQPLFTVALLWEREPLARRYSPNIFHITRRVRLYFRRSAARQDRLAGSQ